MRDGLGHAHSRQLVHRDIKPGNLLLRKSDDCLKIADFGIARAAEDTRLTRPGKVIGTERYMAPEQLRDGKITPATDVYACGVVADEVLPADRPPAMQEIVERCVQEDPAERFPTPARSVRRSPSWTARGRRFPCAGSERTGGRRSAPPGGDSAPLETRTPRRASWRPTRRARRRGGGVEAPAWARGLAIAALAVVGIVAALGSGESDTPTDAKSTLNASSPSLAAVPVPRSEDPAEQARRLSEFLRAQSR